MWFYEKLTDLDICCLQGIMNIYLARGRRSISRNLQDFMSVNIVFLHFGLHLHLTKLLSCQKFADNILQTSSLLFFEFSIVLTEMSLHGLHVFLSTLGLNQSTVAKLVKQVFCTCCTTK